MPQLCAGGCGGQEGSSAGFWPGLSRETQLGELWAQKPSKINNGLGIRLQAWAQPPRLRPGQNPAFHDLGQVRTHHAILIISIVRALGSAPTNYLIKMVILAWLGIYAYICIILMENQVDKILMLRTVSPTQKYLVKMGFWASPGWRQNAAYMHIYAYIRIQMGVVKYFWLGLTPPAKSISPPFGFEVLPG